MDSAQLADNDTIFFFIFFQRVYSRENFYFYPFKYTMGIIFVLNSTFSTNVHS